jgi:S-adenosylmethionine:tRNA ribosyltransferase-isomerase
MKLSDFDYHLPKQLIAQEPAEIRDQSKLLVLDLTSDSIEHLRFNQLPEILTKDDTLVLNDTRVVDARIFGYKPTGGKIELLILEPYSTNYKAFEQPIVFECLVKGKVSPGQTLKLTAKSKPNNNAKAHVIKNISGGRFEIEFETTLSFSEFLSSYGHIPLPPYIKKSLEKPDRYQTIYSSVQGSVAAPTAGLHFSSKLLNNLKENGVTFAHITLHISYGTFTPVRTEDITHHKMDREYAILTIENADVINKARNKASGRLIAVGTTTVRTLETIAIQNPIKSNQKLLLPWEGWSELFIYPGFKFKAGIDIMITNFHLPKSTLLMLVSAFASRDKIFNAYQEAVKKNYRFYSFGDAMMIIK